MPSYVAHRAQNILNEAGLAINGSGVLMLDVTYKPNIADQRESPAGPLARALAGLGAKVMYHDPYVTEWTTAGVDVLRAEDLEGAVADADLVVLVQNHSAYQVDRLAGMAQRFFDTRGATSHPTAYRL